MLRAINIRVDHRCAFCQHWYDPTNSAIKPQNVVGGFWLFDDKAWNICKVYGAKKPAGAGCSKYICKI